MMEEEEEEEEDEEKKYDRCLTTLKQLISTGALSAPLGYDDGLHE